MIYGSFNLKFYAKVSGTEEVRLVLEADVSKTLAVKMGLASSAYNVNMAVVKQIEIFNLKSSTIAVQYQATTLCAKTKTNRRSPLVFWQAGASTSSLRDKSQRQSTSSILPGYERCTPLGLCLSANRCGHCITPYKS